jgi:uncharacterized protein
MGLGMFLKSDNQLIVLGAMIIGTLLGEWWKLEDGLHRIGDKGSKNAFPPIRRQGQARKFVRGFMVASLLYLHRSACHPRLHPGRLDGDYNLLAVKSTLDGFASIAFASTLGVGVLFSSVIVLVYQGGISLMAGGLSAIITEPMMNEMTATGGVILVGLAISNLLEIKKIRVGNFLPALAVAPLIVWVLEKLAI